MVGRFVKNVSTNLIDLSPGFREGTRTTTTQTAGGTIPTGKAHIMPVDKTTYRCLLISPSDVGQERDAVEEAVRNWNAIIGNALKVAVELVRWESHVVPSIGSSPQETVNRQIVDSCDLGIAIFWSRLGTPTETHGSGSLEEIDRLCNRSSPVMVYLKTSNIPQDTDLDQFERVKQAKADLMKKGIVSRFDDPAQLKSAVVLHLTQTIGGLAVEAHRLHDPARQSSEVPQRPDVRVHVSPALTQQRGGTFHLVAVKAANHSNVKVHMSHCALRLFSGNDLICPRNPFNGEYQPRRELTPGDSLECYFPAKELFSNCADAEDYDRVILTDAIGRRFESTPGQLSAVVADVFASLPRAT